MILNDKDIRELAMREGIIRPFYPNNVRTINGGARALSYGTSSFGYDFTLAEEVRLFCVGYLDTLDVKDFDVDAHTTLLHVHKRYVDPDHTKGCERWVELPPHSFVLAHTVEYVTMPDDILGICFDKSTYARIGGIQTNVTPIEPGWEGQITLEIRNTLPCFTRLYIGEGIIQTIFLRGNRPETTYRDKKGKYQGQMGITGAKV